MYHLSREQHEGISFVIIVGFVAEHSEHSALCAPQSWASA